MWIWFVRWRMDELGQIVSTPGKAFSLDMRLMTVTIIAVGYWLSMDRLDVLQHGSIVEGAYRVNERL